jgi:hypothetical protein
MSSSAVVVNHSEAFSAFEASMREARRNLWK